MRQECLGLLQSGASSGVDLVHSGLGLPGGPEVVAPSMGFSTETGCGSEESKASAKTRDTKVCPEMNCYANKSILHVLPCRAT